MDIAVIAQNIGTVVATVGLQILGAVVLLIFGRWLIGVVVRLLERSLERQKVDPTVLRYVGSAISVALNIVLVVAILGYFGLETTSFAALLAATGVAIGMAWSGLLANFAAGVFLLILRPFKVEDFIQAGGVMGTVKDIGLFVTTINTLDSADDRRQQQNVFGQHPELYHEPLQTRRSKGSAES
jgi:small conductance mechanosensitive channel